MEETKIKYAVYPTDQYLFIHICGGIALHHALIMDSITFEGIHYEILRKHHDIDKNSYIFVITEFKK